MEESIRFAKQYLEDLLSFFGLNTDVKASYEEDVIELDVPSSRMNGFLIGQRGETLRAIQYMVANALRSNEMEFTRVNVDIASYKQNRRDRLAAKTEEWIDEVVSSKQDKPLRPMNAADRRVVHKTVTEYGKVDTESVGEGRDRHVVLKYRPLAEPETETEPEPASEEAKTEEE